VLSEMRQFEDARTALARSIEAQPEYAQSHYNMSFVLSNLGDFEGALRETKRALELDPYYVAQKFELAMDAAYEDTNLSIQPDLGAERSIDAAIPDFSFDPQSLDSLFSGLRPPEIAPASRVADPTPFALAADYLSKGLYDRAAAEVSRAMARGNARGDGLALQADIYAKQGLYGEALERYRDALRLEPNLQHAVAGEAWSLVHLGRSAEALPLARRLSAAHPDDVDMLMLSATACADCGQPADALSFLDAARRLGPMRADVQRQIGDISRRLGDVDGAITAYRRALELDPDFAVVRFQLSRLLESRGQDREAERELTAALDAVPTYAEATLALAALRRRKGRPGDSLIMLIEVLERDPYNFDALLALGDTLAVLGRDRDAIYAFNRILRFDPSHVVAAERLRDHYAEV
jgi:tetratricopeptide (TPR) repeat protein